jgi:hypothetical protein
MPSPPCAHPNSFAAIAYYHPTATLFVLRRQWGERYEQRGKERERGLHVDPTLVFKFFFMSWLPCRNYVSENHSQNNQGFYFSWFK